MLTDSQRKTYEFIRDYFVKHGYSPKLNEIANGIGIKSKGVVHRYLQAIVEAGLIQITPKQHRGIQLLETMATSVQGAVLPLLGKIAAGQPIQAIENQDDIDLATLFPGGDIFALKVQGDSMIDAGILDGDTVVCERRQQASNGEIVVALVDQEEATLKKFQNNRDGTVTLVPANETLSPMTYPSDRVIIQGVLVGQLRVYD